MNRLQNQVALVTGASLGIGRAAALCLAEEGADVVITYRTHPKEAQDVVGEIARMGRRALAYQADVADRLQVRDMVERAVQEFGQLDIVVANAGYSVRQPVIEAEWEDVQRVIAVSQFGVFHTCQCAAQQMVARGKGGKIIVISSIHGEVPFACSAAYNMAKAAINHLAATMANELARHRVNVNVINSGWIDTPGERELATDEELERGARRIPWGRLGTAREIARCIVFLASDDADYITGTCLRVDGGYMVGMTLPNRDEG
jgi:glucose 1-dehydrogenase